MVRITSPSIRQQKKGNAALAMKKMFFSCEKAKRELGYAPRPAREAIIDAVTWFDGNGYLG